MSPVTTLTDRRVDFTSKDFQSWVVDLRAMAQAVFPFWTDYNKANIGNLFLELYAHTLDVITYSIDQQTLECFILTTRLRKSMIDHGKKIGFALPGAAESSVDLEFTIADGQARSVDIIIPAGAEVRAPDIENPVSFFTVEEARITQGNIQISNVAARNAAPQFDVFTADGSPNQKYALVQTPYLDGSADVVVGSETYLYVSNLLEYGPSDKVFTAFVDENDVGYILFGDGVNGYTPSGLGSVAYETGGGEIANVEANAIDELLTQVKDERNNIVRLLVRNPSKAGGGTDRMSVEEARVAIPESVLTVNLVTCTADQFEINPKQVRGVARTLVLTSDDEPTIPEYTANVYIVPTGGGLPSAALKNEVLEMITVTRPQPVGMDVNILDPLLKIISISATIYLEYGYTETEVRANVEASLEAFFALMDIDGNPNPLIDFGFHIKDWQGYPDPEVPWSDVFNAVRDAEGVRKVTQTPFSPATDVILANNEFPVLGSVSLYNGDTGDPF